MNRDNAESWANAVGGALISLAIVYALRALGLWDTLPAWAVVAVFLGASYGRARALRAAFRRAER